MIYGEVDSGGQSIVVVLDLFYCWGVTRLYDFSRGQHTLLVTKVEAKMEVGANGEEENKARISDNRKSTPLLMM